MFHNLFILDPESILPGYDPLQSNIEDTDEILIKPKNYDSLKRAASRINALSDTIQTNTASTLTYGTVAATANTTTTSSLLHTKSSITNHNRTADELEEDSSFDYDSDTEITPSTAPNNQLSIRKTINPFSPSTIKVRMSFDRRRFAHLFPLRSDGTPIFQHWMTVTSIDLSNSNQNIPNILSMKSLTSNSNNNNGISSITNLQNLNKKDSFGSMTKYQKQAASATTTKVDELKKSQMNNNKTRKINENVTQNQAIINDDRFNNSRYLSLNSGRSESDSNNYFGVNTGFGGTGDESIATMITGTCFFIFLF